MIDCEALCMGVACAPLRASWGGGGAEGVGFEPTGPGGPSVFKTDAIDHSATPPDAVRQQEAAYDALIWQAGFWVWFDFRCLISHGRAPEMKA
jgi:hypothetical protein